MKEVVADLSLVARCGLYCGACGAWRRGRCPGCRENDKATWCGIRKCCADSNYASCADCATHTNARDCRKFDNLLGRIIGFILRSNRSGCIARIREIGAEAYAREMAAARRQSVPR